MKFRVHFTVVIVLDMLVRNIFVSAQLTAVNDSPFVEQFYLRIGNHRPPPPSEMDAHPNTRKEICQQITNSLFFLNHGKKAIDMDQKKTYKQLKKEPKYKQFFLELYERISERPPSQKWPKHHQYINPYRLKPFRIYGLRNREYRPAIIPLEEHVFLCLVKNRKSKVKIPYYVSKEYNVFHAGQESSHRVSGRFVFKPPPSNVQLVILAEEPAKVIEESLTFNIEIHYLQTRRDRTREEFRENDPICRLIPPAVASNQNHRICLSVLGSTFFDNKYIYAARPERQDPCRLRRVSFQSPQAIAEVGRTGTYEEWVVHCLAKRADNKAEVNFAVSRSYESGQMFVYRLVLPDYHAYLENRSRNMSIIDEYDEVHHQEMLNKTVELPRMPGDYDT